MPLEDGFCPDCSKGREFYFTKAYASLPYSGAVVSLIHCLKYSGATKLAKPLIEMSLVDELKNLDIDILTYVPLHKTKYRSRGFNQAELIGKELKKHLCSKIKVTKLIRRRYTSKQADLNPMQRAKNVEQAFAIRKKNLALFKNKNVLIVDDILTTGATVNAICTELKKAKVNKIYVFCIARAGA